MAAKKIRGNLIETGRGRREWMRRILLVLTVICLFILQPGLVIGSQYLKLPLTKLVPYPVAELKGYQASLNVKLPVPARWRIGKADLHCTYSNSEALLPERSKMVVRLNGHALTQVTLMARSPSGRIDTALPPEYLLPDYNDLDFHVFQHYSYGCNDPDAPELWTSIDLEKSFIELEYTLEPIPLNLTSVSKYLFDPKTPETADVHIVLEDLNEEQVRLAAIAASGVALHYSYRPVRFTISSEIRPDRDNVAIGERGFITDLLKSGAVKLPEGHIGLLPLPAGDNTSDPGRGLVVLTGENREALDRAVSAFSVMTDPMPDAAFITVKELHLPELNRYSVKNALAPGKPYYFHQLGYTNQTRTGTRSWAIGLEFKMPADYFIKTNKSVFLSLHLAYGAKMRADSVLNVFMNDVFSGVIPLDDTAGGTYLAYEMEIPNRLLKPGGNRITFQPVLTPSESRECTFYQTGNLSLTLYDDSTITLPDMSHWVRMPELEFFFQDGFPMTRWPDWRETLVCLTDSSLESAASAVNLVAAICQKNRICPFGIAFAMGVPQGAPKDLLVVGPMDSLPPVIKDRSPLTQSVTYPLREEKAGGHEMTTWLGRLFHGDRTLPSRVRDAAEVVFESTLERGKLVLTEYESPFQASRSVLLVTAQSPLDLLSGTQALWEPAVQSGMSRSLAVLDWNNKEIETHAYRAGPVYYIGKIGTIAGMDHLIYTHPWLLFISLAVCLFLLAWVLLFFIKRHRRKRLKNE